MAMKLLLEDLYIESNNIIINLQKSSQGQYSNDALQQRLEILLMEFHKYGFLCLKEADGGSKEKLKNHLSVLYRDADSIDEMYTMLKRINPINLDIPINVLKKALIDLVPNIVQLYGSYQAKFIVTPGYQRLSGL